MKDVPASCAVCAKAKSKCVRLPGQEACDRCTRLQKECHDRAQITRRRKPIKITNANQLQTLERKIESLSHALITKPCQDDQLTVTESAQVSPSDTSHNQETNTDPAIHGQHAAHTVTLGPIENSSQFTVGKSISSFANLSPHESENLLQRYTVLMASHMPFVLLPALPITTSSFAASPLLLRAIITVSHFHDTFVQQVLVKDLIDQITSAIFANAEVSLDLLQALLVLCTWYNPHLLTSTSHTTLLHLCMTVTTDLAIDRDPASCEMAYMTAAMKSCGIPQPIKIVSDEERRAVLGVFWVASTVFTSFRKTDVPSWTPWLQQCLEVMKTTGLESDRALVSLVQSQRVMHQAMSTPSLLYDPDPEALQSELDNISPADPYAAQDTSRTLLQLQRTAALVAIHEPSFSSRKLESVWPCVSALTSFLTLYAALPVSSYLTVPFTVFAQFAYVFVVMVRASSLQMDGFDSLLLRDWIDFGKVMDDASAKYEAVGQLYVDGKSVRNEGFKAWARKCRWVRTWWGMQTRADTGEAGDDGAQADVLTALEESSLADAWSGSEQALALDVDFASFGPVPI